MKSTLLIFVALLSSLQVFSQVAFKPHYINHTEVGALFGRVRFDAANGWGTTPQYQVQNRINLTLQTFNGLQYTPRLGVGLTTGVDWYTAALLNPIALGARYDLAGKKNIRLYASGDAGYAFAWFHQGLDRYHTKGGLMLSSGLGLRMGKPDGAAYTLSFSYKRQNASVSKPPLSNETSRIESREYNRLVVRMGISF
jgi:hypothetical protein